MLRERVPLRRRTALVAEVVSCCVCAPLIEECVKLWAARRCVALRDATASASKPPPHAHAYLAALVASGVGLKMADVTRRVSCYSRPWHPQKYFFAAARGALPIHELCAALTATRCARSDQQRFDNARARATREHASFLAEEEEERQQQQQTRQRVTRADRRRAARCRGARERLDRAQRRRAERAQKTPLAPLAVVLPAALLHASANFRGMKPLFKWGSDAPWVELQLQAWNAPDDATPFQLLVKSAYSFMWWALLLRVLAYATHDYYIAVKKTTPPDQTPPTPLLDHHWHQHPPHFEHTLSSTFQ